MTFSCLSLSIYRAMAVALLVRRQTRTLLPGYPGNVVLDVEQLLRVLGQRSHPAHGSEGP
jgi:hypothetical protein